MRPFQHIFCIIFCLLASLFVDVEMILADEQPRTIFFGTVIRNNDQTLPMFLRSLERLDYDKKLITLQINLFNESEAIKKLFKGWVDKNKSIYKDIIFVDNSRFIEKKLNEADLNRVIAGVKDEYLIKTKMRQCDSCMIIASDVFLEPKTLKVLVQKNKPVVAPLLRPIPEPNDPFRNFFAAVTDTGYYKDHSAYLPIANREKLGTFGVPCVNMAYMIDAKCIDKLSFSDNFTFYDLISFSNNARKNNVNQYICNENEFGFFLHFNKAMTSEEEKSFALLGSELEVTPEFVQTILRPYAAEDSDLKSYADNFKTGDYSLYRVQNKDLFYMDGSKGDAKKEMMKKGFSGEEHLDERFEKYVKVGSTVVEIGGDSGMHALNLSRRVGDKGEVHVFEPQNKAFSELAINMHLNDRKNVILHRIPLGANYQSAQKPKQAALDELNLKNVSFVKIDSKDLEMDILKGGQKTIQSNLPVMLIKIYATSDKKKKIEAIERLGFFSVPIEEDDYLFLPSHLMNMTEAVDSSELSKPVADLQRNLFKASTKNGSEINKKPVSVAWEGTFVDCGSLSNVNRSITKPLRDYSEIKLTCVGPNVLTSKLSAIPELSEMSRHVKSKAPDDTAITVRHAWPPNWEAPAKGKWVIIQPWEFGALPEEWVEKIKKVDEVWSPSNFVKREYVESGVPAHKIHIVPNGIDPDKFALDVEPYPLPTKKKFKFLFLGGTIWRKGGDLLLSTYLRTFNADDDVCLVIKDFGSKGCYAGQTHDAQIKAAQKVPGNPEIVYFDNDMSVDEIASLYSACDCLIYPYRGEGFALPVLEAMASGLPVVVTAGGPTDDFVSKESGWFIPSHIKTYGPTLGDFKLVADSWLLEPDTDILSAQLHWLVKHPAEVHAKGLAASKHARKNWTWEQAAAIAAERLKALNN